MSRQAIPSGKGLTSDQTIEFTGTQTAKKCPIKLRRISYKDPETGKHYIFLTDNFKSYAVTISYIYKSHCQSWIIFQMD